MTPTTNPAVPRAYPVTRPDALLVRGRADWPQGHTAITRIGESDNDTGMDFGVLRLDAGETSEQGSTLEAAWLLLSGRATLRWDGGEATVERGSLFDQLPIALHAAGDTAVRLTAVTACEFVVARAVNAQRFAPRLFDAASMLQDEHRMPGVLDGTCYRRVRTIFDARNRPEANLVLGEVVTQPGRWSSYPPHHHAHPEIYHYRFSEPAGYGHGESGETVARLRQGDTLKILDRGVHPQVAAPGYAMWYCWALLNLPGQPYRGPDFVPDHTWTMQPGADQRCWRAQDDCPS